MSNHHQGNEWYRRLIRSNRPLYRACEKHKKLLVSKAIVQAVEQQGGRFLEKDKDSGHFIQVSYKRAVDKTSQGLREREREEEDDDSDDEDSDEQKLKGDSSTDAVKMKKKTTPMAVPEAFSGRNKNPNMRELATVAIGMTNRGAPTAGGDQKKRFVEGNSSSSASKRQKIQIVVGTKSHADLLADDDDENTDEQGAVGFAQKLGANRFPTAFAPSSFTTNQGGISGGKSPLNLLDGFGIVERASQTANIEHIPPTFMPSFGQSSFGFRQPVAQQHGVTFPMGTMPGIYWVNPAASSTPLAFMPVPGMDASPPPLSRLTSQVSDWLTSFWPLANSKSQELGQTANLPASLDAPTTSESIPQSIAKQIKIPAPLDDEKPQIFTVPPPTKRSIVHMQKKGLHKQHSKEAQHLTHNGMLLAQNDQVSAVQQAQLQAWRQFQAQQVALQQQFDRQDFGNLTTMPVTQAAPAIVTMDHSKRKSRSYNSPPLPYDNAVSTLHAGAAPANATNRIGGASTTSMQQTTNEPTNGRRVGPFSAPPTELEQSVSTTLLKLAGSRLVSGLTSFYDRPHGTGNGTATAQEGTNESQRPPNRRNLLDDYEETEEEARIRAVEYKV
jgi:hypothetical protein